MSDISDGSQRAVSLTDVTAGHWTLDPAQSTVNIENKSIWGLVNVKGVFTKVVGEGEVLAGGSAHGTLTIDVAALDTKHAKRDTHLRGTDFFDVDKHPSITFTATSVTANRNGTAEVTGELTVRGTTRPLTLTAQASEVSADAVTLTASLSVERTNFGITWNQLGMLKPLTFVTITARFTRQSA